MFIFFSNDSQEVKKEEVSIPHPIVLAGLLLELLYLSPSRYTPPVSKVHEKPLMSHLVQSEVMEVRGRYLQKRSANKKRNTLGFKRNEQTRDPDAGTQRGGVSSSYSLPPTHGSVTPSQEGKKGQALC